MFSMGCNGKLTRHRGVGRGSAGRRDGSRARSRLLGLSGARRWAHWRGRWSTPLAGEVGGGVRREGGLSLVTGTPLLPMAAAATAAGGAAGADSWAQTGLRPCGEVINRAGQILEQRKGLNVRICEAHPSIFDEKWPAAGGKFKRELEQRGDFPVKHDVMIQQLFQQSGNMIIDQIAWCKAAPYFQSFQRPCKLNIFKVFICTFLWSTHN